MHYIFVAVVESKTGFSRARSHGTPERRHIRVVQTLAQKTRHQVVPDRK